MRHASLAGSLAMLLLLAPCASAQVIRSGLVPDITARQLGLTRSWYTHVEVDRGRGSIQYVTPFVSHDSAHTIHEVIWETGKLEFSELDRDAFNNVIGVEGSLEAANTKIEQLKKDGFDPKLITRRIPEITLYVTTDRGVIQAIDGETGETRWSRAVGRPDFPCLEPGVSEEFVAVVNGSHVYIFKRKTGEFVWERKLGGVPGAGPVVSREYVFAPLVSGRMELYRLRPEGADKEAQQRSLMYRAPTVHVAIGRNLIQPVCTPLTCAWPTDRGYMYVGSANRDDLLYRSQANDTVTSPITYDPKRNQLFMTSIDGYVYALHELTGEVHWRFSAGSEISSSAYPIEDAVYVITDEGGMYKVDAETGLELWWTPRIAKFLSASVPPSSKTPAPAPGDAAADAAAAPETPPPAAEEKKSPGRLYCLDPIGRLVVLDAATGGRLGTLATEELNLIVPNVLTDRIYIGTKSGIIQCLHELQLERPIVHAGPGSEAKETIQVKVGEPTEPAAGGGAADPSDPFGLKPAGGTPPATSPDPFGGGGGTSSPDPFGGGGSSSPDPFGSP